MIRGVGIGETTGAGIQPPARGESGSLRSNASRGAGSAAASAELPSRPRAPGPTEANGPQVWGNGFLSPVYRFDDSTSTLFFEQRAFVSGDTTRQVPLESAVKLYRLFEQVRENPLPGQSGAGGREDSAEGQTASAPPAEPQTTPQEARPPVTSQVDASGPGAGGGPGAGPGGGSEETAPFRQQAGAAAGQVLDIVA